jgi:hypothetical protein
LANLAMGVITTTIIATPIAYILGGNPKGNSQPPIIQQTGDSPSATNVQSQDPLTDQNTKS